jgi:beta,beta-carotene 9',10'-dioxygenase
MTKPSAISHQEKWNTTSFFSSTQECNNPVKLIMSGKLPSWIKGCLYRNGPGQFEVNKKDLSTSVNHPFDGFAYINKYEIDGENDCIYFQGSFIKSRSYKESVKRGCLVTRQFATDPCKSLFSRFQLLFSPEAETSQKKADSARLDSIQLLLGLTRLDMYFQKVPLDSTRVESSSTRFI